MPFSSPWLDPDFWQSLWDASPIGDEHPAFAVLDDIAEAYAAVTAGDFDGAFDHAADASAQMAAGDAALSPLPTIDIGGAFDPGGGIWTA